MPFKIGNFRNKVISLLSKCEFRKSSLIVLLDYVIDKNERKIKKNGIELKLTEKERSSCFIQKSLCKNKEYTKYQKSLLLYNDNVYF